MILSRRLGRGVGSIRYIGYASNHVNSANFSVSLSGIAWAPGDLAILYVASDTRDDAYTVTAGWSEIVPANTSANRESSIWTRTLASGDTTVASTNFSGGNTIATVIVFRNASLIAGDCSLAYMNTGMGSFEPLPPAAAVSDVVADDVVLVLAMHDEISNYFADTGPQSEGYTLIVAEEHTGTRCSTGLFYKNGLTGTPDPANMQGVFTSSSWVAHTTVLRQT